MILKWHDDVRLNSDVTNDQPPFQEIAKQQRYLSYHKCSDEADGFAMWFHKKKISGSGLNKDYYFNNKHLIKVFHVNDVTSSSKKIDVLKKLGMWFVISDKKTNGNKTIEYLNTHTSFSSVTSTISQINDSRSNKFFIYNWPDTLVHILDSKHPWRNENYGVMLHSIHLYTVVMSLIVIFCHIKVRGP